ncbi:MAG: cobalamin-binding protein [Archaeoglobaceae archaeon]|nr:cobalamin-binding protein [Archaeoglobaceae archaeon]
MPKTILIILLCFLSTFCIQNLYENPEKQLEKLTDDTGHEITVGRPNRIVSLSPSNTEILFAIGAGEKVVGVTDYCNYPPEVLEKIERGEIERIGGYSNPNIERILALKPELVVASHGNDLRLIENLRKFVKVIAFDPKNIGDIKRAILAIGRSTGYYENAKKLVIEMENRISEIETKKKSGKSVAVIIWKDPLWVSGRDTFIDEAISIAGGVNAFNFSGWKIINYETLVIANPDVIILSGDLDSEEWIINEKRLKDVKAVKNGKVFVIASDLISRPGPRIVDAIEQIYNLIND